MPKVMKVSSVPKTWEAMVEQYLLFKQAQGLRETTLTGQGDVLNAYFRRNTNALNDPKNAVYSFMSEGIKPATYNYRLSYLKSFYDWAIQQDIYSENPTFGLKKRKTGDRIVNIEIGIIQKLLELPDKRTYAGLRDYALLLLTLDTGIRPKEAFHLSLEDINSRTMEVHIRPEVSKTGRDRILPISPATAQAIKNLIQNRHEFWNNNIPVFCSAEGTIFNKDSWGDRLEQYSITLSYKIKPYDLRHTFALIFLRNGGNALALQRIMGHSDLSMTKKYIALTGQDLREQHLIASPLNFLITKRNRIRKI